MLASLGDQVPEWWQAQAFETLRTSAFNSPVASPASITPTACPTASEPLMASWRGNDARVGSAEPLVIMYWVRILKPYSG